MPEIKDTLKSYEPLISALYSTLTTEDVSFLTNRDESVAVVACKAMCNFALRKNGLKDFFSDVALCDRIELLESRYDDGDLCPVLRHLTKLLLCGQKRRGK